MASTYLSLNVHVVFATRQRAPVITDLVRPDLHAYIGGTIRGLDLIPMAVGGVADHVHFLARMKSTHAIADIVREVKKASSLWMVQRHPDFAWQEGYGAFSVSPKEVPGVVAYIAAQEEHHRTLSSADEMRALLQEFDIEYDARYFD
jgi:REP element-mobilizing transposase RayT